MLHDSRNVIVVLVIVLGVQLAAIASRSMRRPAIKHGLSIDR
jgi:hypothetical protein